MRGRGRGESRHQRVAKKDSNSQSTRGEMTVRALRVRADESLLYRARFTRLDRLYIRYISRLA